MEPSNLRWHLLTALLVAHFIWYDNHAQDSATEIWKCRDLFFQLMLNSFAIASKIDIQLGEVPKGQEKNVKKAHFIQVNIFRDKILI